MILQYDNVEEVINELNSSTEKYRSGPMYSIMVYI